MTFAQGYCVMDCVGLGERGWHYLLQPQCATGGLLA